MSTRAPVVNRERSFISGGVNIFKENYIHDSFSWEKCKCCDSTQNEVWKTALADIDVFNRI